MELIIKINPGNSLTWILPQNTRFLFNLQAKCVELYSVCDGVRDCLFGGDEGSKLCTKRFCKENLGGRWKCPNEAKCIFEFQVCAFSDNLAIVMMDIL